MAVIGARRSAVGAPRWSTWGMAIWLLLLLAALGCLQYLHHGQLVWQQLRDSAQPAVEAPLQRMLAWDIAYLAAAFGVIVCCAGGVLRQEWARRALRWIGALLALWSVLTAVAMWGQWDGFEQARQFALAQPQGSAELLLRVERAQRSFVLALAFKVLAVPLLLWLSWRLGRLDVRAAFHRRRLH